MTHLKPILTCLAVSATLLFSCNSKDVDGSGSGSCKVITEYSYDINTGAKDDSVTFSYTGNKVSKVEFSYDKYYTIVYAGDNVSRRNYYSTLSSTTPFQYQQITYNPDNSIQKIEEMEKASSGYVMVSRLDFTYSSGKITKVLGSEVVNNVVIPSDEYTYGYTGENITSARYLDYASGVTETTGFTYDSNENYFKKQNNQFLLVDPFLFVDGTSIPLIMSANNVTALTITGIPVPILITYQLDDRQNVSIVKANGRPLISYSYQCR